MNLYMLPFANLTRLLIELVRCYLYVNVCISTVGDGTGCITVRDDFLGPELGRL